MAKTKKNVRTKKATAAYVAKMATIRENREQWLTALESGKYKQGMGQLRGRETEKSSYKYCCLGVLCNLHKDKKNKWDEDHFMSEYPKADPTDSWEDEGEYWDMPPDSFLDKVKVDSYLAEKLATMNDNGKTFKEIAAFLRRKWRMPKA